MATNSSAKRRFFTFLTIAVCTFAAGLCQAGTITDNFDGFSLNYQLWEPLNQSPKQQWAQQGGELRIRIDGADTEEDGTGVNSKFMVKGDFDMTVDYRLITWPEANGVGVGLEDECFVFRRRSGIDPNQPDNPSERYKLTYLDGSLFGGKVLPATNKEGDSGKLRLTRAGSLVTAYFYENGDWQAISHDYSHMSEWVAFCLSASTGTTIFGGKTVEIAFDNFQLTYDQIKSTSLGGGLIIDNFDGAVINTRLWRPFEESRQQRLAQQGGELRIQVDGDSNGGAGLRSKFLLKGDFEATVDYRLINWPQTNGVRVGFEGPGSHSDQVFLVKRISFGPEEPPNPKEVYSTYFFDGPGGNGNMVATADNHGSLKLTRVGSVLTGYFKQNGVWQPIASHDYSASGYREWVELTLWAVSPPFSTTGQNVEIAFDNFRLIYDQIKYTAVSAPMTMLLLE